MIAPLLLLALLHRADADTSLHLPHNGAVEIDTRTRDILVRIGTGDLVTVRGGNAELDGGTLQVDEADRHGHDRGSGVLEVTVPAFARLEITTIGGNITINGTPVHTEASTVNGVIQVNGGSGSLELESVAGVVTVNDFHGTRLSIDATGENVSVTNATGAIEVDNVNGAVSLHGIHSSDVSASSVNEPVEFEGDLAPAGRYEFDSQNADVTLVLPPTVSARMRISTLNGQLLTRIPAVTNGSSLAGTRDAGAKDKSHKHHGDDDDEHTFVVVYGGGAASVSVDAFNGNVIVKPAGTKP